MSEYGTFAVDRGVFGHPVFEDEPSGGSAAPPAAAALLRASPAKLKAAQIRAARMKLLR